MTAPDCPADLMDGNKKAKGAVKKTLVENCTIRHNIQYTSTKYKMKRLLDSIGEA